MPSRKSRNGDGLVITGREAQQEVSEELLTADVLSPEEALLPCSLNAAMAGASGGALGAVFGFGGKAVRHSGPGRWRAARTEALTSAKSFATFSGVFALASCLIKRLRNKQDALNGGLAGAVTGFVLGWNGGPWAAAQSAAMLGAFSYFVDSLNASEAQACAAVQARRSGVRRHPQQQQVRLLGCAWPPQQAPAWPQAGSLGAVLAPALALLAPCRGGACAVRYKAPAQGEGGCAAGRAAS